MVESAARGRAWTLCPPGLAAPFLSLLACVLVAVGLAGLAFGADWLVEGSSGLARRFRVSPVVIGLTVVAYGTSAPEIGASLVAVLRESPGLAVGNVVGSNAANLGLILGLTAAMRPFAVDPKALRREFVVLLLVTALLWPLAAAGHIGRSTGLFLLGLLVAFNWISIRWSRESQPPDGGGEASALGRSLLRTAGGLAVLLVGADLLIRGATDIARGLGASETTIGITLVAVGTSLPELAASVAAVRRGAVQLAAGNVIGSNLFNVLGALGLPAAVAGVAIEPGLLGAEIPGVMLLTLMAGVVMFTGARLTRLEGILLLLAYAAYLGVVLW